MTAAPLPLGRRAACYALLTVLGCAGCLGCASGEAVQAGRGHSTASALNGYLRQIEPIRLAVNRLLDHADPVLSAFRERRIAPAEAARRMGDLEQRFATYTVDVEAIQPAAEALRSLHAGYAQTYILEDAYLNALVSGLAHRNLGGLPTTEARQRAAIIAWRTRLAVLAREARIALPADLEQAGRGEIAPSPEAS